MLVSAHRQCTGSAPASKASRVVSSSGGIWPVVGTVIAVIPSIRQSHSALGLKTILCRAKADRVLTFESEMNSEGRTKRGPHVAGSGATLASFRNNYKLHLHTSTAIARFPTIHSHLRVNYVFEFDFVHGHMRLISRIQNREKEVSRNPCLSPEPCNIKPISHSSFSGTQLRHDCKNFRKTAIEARS